MKTFFTVLVIIGVVMLVMGAEARYDVQDHEMIKRILEFSSGNGTKVLEVDNVQGAIHVTGYSGRNVEMTVNKTIRAESQDKLQRAKQEVKLDINDKSDTINIYVDQPGHNRSTRTSSHSHWSHDRGYEVTFDFDLQVPREATVHLWTVNNGDIVVRNLAGDFDVSNVNGGIEMREISGSGDAYTVNGPVKVAFANNPTKDSTFHSINGVIEVAFQKNLSANLRYKTFNGGVYTDFPITALPQAPGTAERRNGKFVYRSNGFSGARVGNGGPEMRFDGFNGNIRILEAK